MSDDNKLPPGSGNIVDLSKIRSIQAVEKPKGSSGLFEIHMLPNANSTSGEQGTVERAKGFLKFGPGFTAIVEGPEDESPVTFAVVTNAIQYIKRIDEDGTVQGTLSV